MNPWYAKAVIIAASILLMAIRAPHGQRSRTVTIAKNRKGTLEVVVLSFAMLGFVVPLIWVVSPLFARAEYTLHPLAFWIGVACFAVGLWLFHRSHTELGTNWSVTLQIREQHRFIKEGVYRRIRHPMYTSLFLYAIGQLLVLPNWIAGPSYLVTFGILFALRLEAEERMMLEEFGDEYRSYKNQTKRIIPGVW
jgi:protein-S-isoprenylcysteine O-methyltransferase Ste14